MVEKVSSSAGSVPQVAHPPGAVPDEAGTKALNVTGSTATECALLPVGNCATSFLVAASITASTGVQGEAALQAPLVPALPDAVQRLAPL